MYVGASNSDVTLLKRYMEGLVLPYTVAYTFAYNFTPLLIIFYFNLTIFRSIIKILIPILFHVTQNSILVSPRPWNYDVTVLERYMEGLVLDNTVAYAVVYNFTPVLSIFTSF